MSCDSLAHNTIQLGYLRLLYNEDDAARLQTKTFVLFLEHAVAPVCTHGACCRQSSAHIHGHIHFVGMYTGIYICAICLYVHINRWFT